jgi:hypothetical protein
MQRRFVIIGLGVVVLVVAGLLFIRLGRSPSPDALTKLKPYCVSGDVSVERLHVPPGGTCEFDPGRDSTLHVTDGSILVQGLLRMRPSDYEVTHRIVFENVEEEGFEGAGMGPTSIDDPILDSDPGLWVMGEGSLDLRGSRRTGWTRAPEEAVGWQPTDELRITPTDPEDFESRPWKPGDEIPRAYPDVPSAEVFNLTRNVVISGTPDGNAHVFIRSEAPSDIYYASFEHLGPRCECEASEVAPEEGPITGRWALHWHHNHPSERASVVEGAVVQHAPARGFVPHLSDNISFTDTVAYDVDGAAYWWDPPEKDTESHTDGTLWHRALASDVRGSAFFLGDALIPGSNRIVDSVAAATIPDEFSTTTAGFQWGSKGDGVWATQGIISHNNRRGIYRWNNHQLEELSDETILYNNHASFIQGAYGANHLYDGLTLRNDSVIWKTGAGEIKGGDGPSAGIIDFDIDVRGRAEECVHLSGAQVPGGAPTVFRDGSCEGYTGRFAFTGDLMQNERAFDFVRVTNKFGEQLEPSDFDIEASKPEKGLDLVIRVQHDDGTAYQMTWRGEDPKRRIQRIAPFTSTK